MALALDQTVFGTQTSTTGTVTSASLTTTANPEVLYAVIITDGATANISAVTGASLTWEPIYQSKATNFGSVEVWAAIAPNIVSSQTITATSSLSSADMSIQIITFTGANPNNPLGSHEQLQITAGTATIDIVTLYDGGWIWAAALNTSRSGAATVGGGQTKTEELLDTTDSKTQTYWQNNASTTNMGTAVTMNLTTNTSDNYNIIAFEIAPSGVTDGQIVVPTGLSTSGGYN